MEELISGEEQSLIFKQKVLFIITTQSAISFICAYLCFAFSMFSSFFLDNFWILYASVSLYLIAGLLVLLMKSLRIFPVSFFLLEVVTISANLLDSCVTAMDPPGKFPIFGFLFGGAFGILMYLLAIKKNFQGIRGFACSFAVNSALLVSFILAFLDNWVQMVILFCSGLAFAGFILVIISDINGRYRIKSNEYCYGAIMIYVDMLIVPYIISTLMYRFNKNRTNNP